MEAGAPNLSGPFFRKQTFCEVETLHSIARPASMRIHPHLMTRDTALAHGTQWPEWDEHLVTNARSGSAVADLAK